MFALCVLQAAMKPGNTSTGEDSVAVHGKKRMAHVSSVGLVRLSLCQSVL